VRCFSGTFTFTNQLRKYDNSLQQYGHSKKHWTGKCNFLTTLQDFYITFIDSFLGDPATILRFLQQLFQFSTAKGRENILRKKQEDRQSLKNNDLTFSRISASHVTVTSNVAAAAKSFAFRAFNDN